MARAVLAAVRSLTVQLMVVVAPVVGFASGAEQQTCDPNAAAGVPESAKNEIRSFQQRLESGPFHRELVRRFGKPLSCSMKLDDGNVDLSYAFRGGAQLVARTNPRIEFSEQRLDFQALDAKRVMRLLREAEKDAYRPNGCGIKWNRAEEESGEVAGSREIVYRGDVCNCQAGVFYQKNRVVALVLRSAC
jgi:hypothetical protein